MEIDNFYKTTLWIENINKRKAGKPKDFPALFHV